MDFVELNEKEFDKFARGHKYASFYQTSLWGNLKKNNGWIPHYLGVKDNNKIVCASLILSKSTPIKKNMFYAPRGFLIDYDNYDLLEFFTNELKKYAKKNNAIFIKIDPYLMYQERDINGDIVDNGINNKNGFNNLIKLNYKHFGFNIMQDTLQPRWMFCLDTKNKSLDDIYHDMDPKTRQILHHNEKLGITYRKISYDEIPIFKDIMEHTGERREFLDRPLSYYQEMYKELKDDIMILVAELDLSKLCKNTEDEINSLKNDYEDRKNKHDNHIINMNENKYINKQKQVENDIKRLEDNLSHYNDLRQDGDIITLGGILFLLSNREVLSLVGGSYSKYMEFKSAYSIHFEGIKYAVNNNYDRYNFYGIVGDFDESKPMGGLFTFKKSFSGYVEELIGEFDLVVSKPLYILYNMAFSIYHGLKNIKTKIHK